MDVEIVTLWPGDRFVLLRDNQAMRTRLRGATIDRSRIRNAANGFCTLWNTSELLLITEIQFNLIMISGI
jgi:hypothetical protein